MSYWFKKFVPELCISTTCYSFLQKIFTAYLPFQSQYNLSFPFRSAYHLSPCTLVIIIQTEDIGKIAVKTSKLPKANDTQRIVVFTQGSGDTVVAKGMAVVIFCYSM